MTSTTENIIELLKANEKKILADADAGDFRAKQVISVYGMYYRHPDHPTLGILMGAFDAWYRGRCRHD